MKDLIICKPRRTLKMSRTFAKINHSCCQRPVLLVWHSLLAPLRGLDQNSCISDSKCSPERKTLNSPSKYREVEELLELKLILNSSVSFKFGIVAMMAGLMGVPLGSALAQRLRHVDSTCDPLICAFGLLASAPFVYFALVVAEYNAGWCYFCVFMAEITLNLSWSIVADMLLVRRRLIKLAYGLWVF